jgi:hypothetical protein
MSSLLQVPTTEHAEFDALCAPIGDFETLPTVVAALDADEAPPSDATQGRQELDGLILAGLVSPY